MGVEEVIKIQYFQWFRKVLQYTPGAIRTRDLRIRNPALYPTELQAQLLKWYMAFGIGSRIEMIALFDLRAFHSLFISILVCHRVGAGGSGFAFS
jgi:hypothetical protein